MSSISSSALLEKSCRMSAFSPPHPSSFSKIPPAASARCDRGFIPPRFLPSVPFLPSYPFLPTKTAGGKELAVRSAGGGGITGIIPSPSGMVGEERRDGEEVFFEARKIYPIRPQKRDSPPHSERSARKKIRSRVGHVLRRLRKNNASEFPTSTCQATFVTKLGKVVPVAHQVSDVVVFVASLSRISHFIVHTFRVKQASTMKTSSIGEKHFLKQNGV